MKAAFVDGVRLHEAVTVTGGIASKVGVIEQNGFLSVRGGGKVRSARTAELIVLLKKGDAKQRKATDKYMKGEQEE